MINSAADIWTKVLVLMQSDMTATTLNTWFDDAEAVSLEVTAGTKLGKAVKRNRVRRRIREIYRTNEEKLLPGWDIVVVARTRAVYARYGELERSFLQLCRRLGLDVTEKKP